MRSLRTKLVLGAALATLIACAPGGSGGVVSVAIDGGDRSLAVGQTLALTATVVTSGGTSDAVEWASSVSSVASVDAAGLLSALAVGTTDVTARSASDATKSDTVVVTVGPAGALEWTRQFGTVGHEQAPGVATDANGNVYVAGMTTGTLDGQISAGGFDAFLRSYDDAGAVRWTRQFGTSSNDVAIAVATDASGRVYVVGRTAGDLEGASAGANDVFVRAYNADGDVRWTRQFGTSAEDYVSGVATDANGYVYVVGDVFGSLDGANAGVDDAFVRSYDADGMHRWTRQFGTVASDSARGVATDAEGNVYIAGQTFGALEGASAGAMDAFVRSYDAHGGLRWTRQFGTGAIDGASGVAIDASGNVYVAGLTNGDLEGGSAGGSDAFVRSFDRDGALRWTHQFGSDANDSARGIAVAPDGRIVVTGYADGALDAPHAGDLDVFVRTFRPDGSLAWGRQFGTNSEDVGLGIATDPDGNVYVAGFTFGALVGLNPGGSDAFLYKYGP